MNISARQILMPKNERALKEKAKILVSSSAEKQLNKELQLFSCSFFFKIVYCELTK